jgi:hypothetical protein
MEGFEPTIFCSRGERKTNNFELKLACPVSPLLVIFSPSYRVFLSFFLSFFLGAFFGLDFFKEKPTKEK